jgi:hypothetical protein
VKKLAVFCLLLIMALPAAAVEGKEVKYSGGTVPLLAAGAIGRLDTTSETTVSFEYAGNTFAIPYAKITSFEVHEQLARHLGVVPALFVGLIKARQKRHLVRITYRDDAAVSQVAIFEVSKEMSQTVLSVLRSRAPKSCDGPSMPMCMQFDYQ